MGKNITVLSDDDLTHAQDHFRRAAGRLRYYRRNWGSVENQKLSDWNHAMPLGVRNYCDAAVHFNAVAQAMAVPEAEDIRNQCLEGLAQVRDDAIEVLKVGIKGVPTGWRTDVLNEAIGTVNESIYKIKTFQNPLRPSKTAYKFNK